MKRKTLAPFRLAVVAVERAVECVEHAAHVGRAPELLESELREALLDAERARVAVQVGWYTLADAREFAALETELMQAYRRSVELVPPPRSR